MQQYGSTGSLATSHNTKKLTDDLRELAVAANAMQGENLTSNGDELAKKPSSLLDETTLPRHVVKTVGPSGWEHVENAEQWNDLLSRRSREVWADGIVNMIVELIDVHVEETGKEIAKKR
jgi:hypothetical protein